MEFYIKLNELIKENRITKYKVAKDLHVSQSTVANWCEGITEPRITQIKILASYFNVTTDYLLGLENEDGSKITDIEQEEYIPIAAKSKDNIQRNLTISKSELKKLIAEAIEYSNKNKDK